MSIDQQFKMRISQEDRQMIRDVAKHFERTQGDAIRLIVREVYAAIQEKAEEGQAGPTREQKKAHVTA